MRFVMYAATTVWVAVAAPPAVAQSPDWRSDWEIVDGFRIEIDSEGFENPTVIAMVPDPGSAPGDAFYFVVELAGRIKVVTNDRSVHTFAELRTLYQPGEAIPPDRGYSGAAGICLAPEHGYVFVTFLYRDSLDVLRNAVVRFGSKPQVFGTSPRAQHVFTDVFAADEAAPSHQIGSCQVQDDLLYVSVGDGLKAQQSQYLETTLGKVLRMTLDGEPAAGNPVAVDDGQRTASDYVWAYGFRNPFGLKTVGQRVFVAENGPGVDRFLEVRAGRNYLWDGTDWSMGTNAAVAFAPAISPVQTDFLPATSDLFPEEYRGAFFVASSGGEDVPGPGRSGEKSVLVLDYDFDARAMVRPPRVFLRYRGEAAQAPTGLAFGRDGLYLVPMLPGVDGRTAILRIRWDPANQHAHVIGEGTEPVLLIAQHGCRGCHVIDQRGGVSGPSFDDRDLIDRLEERLDSPEYVDSLAALDTIDLPELDEYADERDEVAAANGEERVRTWLKYRIMEPRFDAPDALMPDLGVTETEAEAIADYLMDVDTRVPDATTGDGFVAGLRARIPRSRHRYTLVAFLAGLVLAAGMGRLRGRRT